MSYKILHDVKCHTCSDIKCHTIFSVMESVILIKLGALSYFGNFFDFGNVFDDIQSFGKGKAGRDQEPPGDTWRHHTCPANSENP